MKTLIMVLALCSTNSYADATHDGNFSGTETFEVSAIDTAQAISICLGQDKSQNIHALNLLEQNQRHVRSVTGILKYAWGEILQKKIKVVGDTDDKSLPTELELILEVDGHAARLADVKSFSGCQVHIASP